MRYPSGPLQRRFPRRVDALADVFGFAAEFCESAKVAGDTPWIVDLTLEELFVNAVKHNPEGEGELLIELDLSDGAVRMAVTDFDADRFDPTEAGPPPDLDAPLRERRPGGLGIHLVKQMNDEIRYEYHDRKSRTIVIKKLG